MSPSERAVRDLIEKNLGLGGSVEDWVLSYNTELTAVTDSRMIEIRLSLQLQWRDPPLFGTLGEQRIF